MKPFHVLCLRGMENFVEKEEKEKQNIIFLDIKGYFSLENNLLAVKLVKTFLKYPLVLFNFHGDC